MGINYPGDPPGSGFDSFTVPTDPEGTPLSEAGSSDRDHPEMHADEGAAIEALESWATLRTHDHSGDGTDVSTGKKLNQANTHQSPDTNTAPTSLHHTVDLTQSIPNAAASATHVHDYTSDRIINKAVEVCTSDNRPASPFLGKLIWETDTNRMRVWAQFSPSNVANVGVYGTDDFGRTSTTSLGSNWNQIYYPTDPSLNPDGKVGGVMAIPDGSNAQWVMDYTPYGTSGKNITWPPNGWPWPYVQGRCIAQRIAAADRHTLTDDQSLVWQAGPTTTPFLSPWPPSPSSNDVYLRMSDDAQTYVKVTFTHAPSIIYKKWLVLALATVPVSPQSELVSVYTTTSGPAGETLLGQITIKHFDPFSTYQVDIIRDTLNFYIDNTFVGKVVDGSGQITTGSSFRGWGIGMTVGRDPSWGEEYAHPTLMNQVWMNDVVYYTGAAQWQILPVGATPVIHLLQSTKQTLLHAGSEIIWDTIEEDNFGFFHPNSSKTDIVVTEPGYYDIDLTLQWGTTYYPDLGSIVVLVNGEETPVRQNVTAYSIGVTPTMGHGAKGSGSKGATYSISVPCRGKLRLAEGDVVSVNVYYTSSANTQDLMESYANPAAKVQSSLAMHFITP